MKVIRITVDHHCPSDNFFHRKPIRFHGQICPPLACQQRWQVACMFWMRLFHGVVVASRFGKVSPGAAFPLVNMESEESRCALPGQARNPRLNQYTFVLLIKPNTSGQLRCIHSTSNFRHRIRIFSAILHWITSYQPMLSAVFCNRRSFEHRVENPEVVGKFFSKVLKISRIFRFCGHCILKNAALSIRCYPIMGQNMGQTVFCEFAEFFSELFDP